MISRFSQTYRDLIIALNKKRLSIFPLSQLNAVSIYTTDFYENYDYDIVLPNQRDRLVKLLTAYGYRQKTGRVIVNADQSIVFEFPKPNFTLGDDPATQAEKLIDRSKSIIILTPTQALLIYLKRFYDEFISEINQSPDTPLINEMLDLLYEQPANLEKVREWLGPSNQTDAFILLKNQFRHSQQDGINDHKDNHFQSRIIDRLQTD